MSNTQFYNTSYYQGLFDSMTINPDKISIVDSIADKITAGKSRYQAIEAETGVPWFFIGIVHYLECNLDFGRHLFNGDPLTARTVNVPAGYPLTGNPPFTFEFSAVEALKKQGLTSWNDWGIPGMLFQLEAYNGFGYRQYHPDVNSPYLWSFSSQYTKGKYVSDGHFDAGAVSAQVGAACILKMVMEKNKLIATVALTGGGLLAIFSLVILIMSKR